MATRSHRKTASAGRILLSTAAIAFAFAACSGCSTKREAAVAATNGGFRNALPGSGIRFTMRFLPNEQGETYKVNLYDHGCGLAVGDYDSDGFEDVYFTNQMGANALFRNKGDGTFEDTTQKAGVGLGDRICVTAVFADYDNDGLQDLFVTSVRGGNVLFRNVGGGQFQDVTKAAGVSHVGHSQAALFFDFNSDGFLDLFVANTAAWTTPEFHSDGRYFTGLSSLQELQQSPTETNILYRNNGKGGFVDVTRTAGVAGLGWAADATALDYDEDGRQDLCVTNMFGRSQLYRNEGSDRFADVTLKVLGRTSWGGMGVKALDIDNNGHEDLFIADMHSDMWMGYEFPASAVEERRKYATSSGRRGGQPTSPGQGGYRFASGGASTDSQAHSDGNPVGGEVIHGNTLFRNEGNGKFTEVSDHSGVETFWPWGSASADFDNDGSVDLFVPSGMGYPFFYWRNGLLMNRGDGTFKDRSREEGLDPPPGGETLPRRIAGKPAVRSSRSAVAADFDHDGRLDLVVNNFNDQPYYYRNHFPGRHFLRLALQGVRSNRDALGASIRLTAGGKTLVRKVEGMGGYLACPSKIVHFGLGDCAIVDRVEIRWPSGARQSLRSPKVDQLIMVKEPGTR